MLTTPLRRSFAVLTVILSASLADARQCLITKVTADDAFAEDHFGESVALAGDTLFVGSPLDNVVGRNSGSVYVLRRDGLNWFESQKLVPPDAERGQAFGARLATDGQTLVVLASRIVGPVGNNTVALYVYELHGGAWSFAAKLEPIDAPDAHSFFFGLSLAVSGDWIFAARPRELIGGGSGSIHAYRRTLAGWVPAEKIVPVDPSVAPMAVSGVSAQGDTLAITAAGALYLFERTGDVWLQSAKLVPHDAPAQNSFGSSVAIDGDTIAVGASSDAAVAPSAGATYVFEKRAGLWVETAKLAPPTLLTRNAFGVRVGLAGDSLVVGTLGRGRNGAAFVFQRSGGAWAQRAELEPQDAPDLGSGSSFFGWGQAISGDLAVFTAPFDDQREPEAGAAYVYSLSGNLCASLSSPRELSWGKQHLEIERGPEHAGHFYWLGGSLSGTLRGVAYRGTRIPLNMDAYFRALVYHPNLGLFTNNFGVLDANGHASLTLKAPLDAYADYLGLDVDHAFVEFGPQGFEHVSNAVSMRFGPRN